MSIDSIPTSQKFKGLSTDTKPTQNVPALSVFMETDTGSVFEYSGTSWNQKSHGGAADVTDGISGTAYYLQTGAITTQVDITLPSDIVYLRVTPRGTAGTIAKTVINAPAAAAAAILVGGASVGANMGYRSIAVGDTEGQQEFYDPDGISLLSLLGAAGVTAVDIMGVRNVP